MDIWHLPTPSSLLIWIDRINCHLKGWQNYFSVGYPRKAMREINYYVYYVRGQMGNHLHQRSQRPYKPPKSVSVYTQLKRLGLIYLGGKR
jgi:RNA-directed DNA polymerase